MCQSLRSLTFLYSPIVHGSIKLLLFKNWAVFYSYLDQTDRKSVFNVRALRGWGKYGRMKRTHLKAHGDKMERLRDRFGKARSMFLAPVLNVFMVGQSAMKGKAYGFICPLTLCCGKCQIGCLWEHAELWRALNHSTED